HRDLVLQPGAAQGVPQQRRTLLDLVAFLHVTLEGRGFHRARVSGRSVGVCGKDELLADGQPDDGAQDGADENSWRGALGMGQLEIIGAERPAGTADGPLFGADGMARGYGPRGSTGDRLS